MEDIVGIITVVAAGDTMLSVREALDLKELLKDMTQNSQELQRLQKRMDVILAVLGDDTEKIRENDRLRIDYQTGIITNLTRYEEYQCSRIPEHLMGVIEAGGLVNYLKLGI